MVKLRVEVFSSSVDPGLCFVFIDTDTVRAFGNKVIPVAETSR